MDNVTWLGVVGVLLLASQLIGLYNSSKTAQRNANEPMHNLEVRMKDIETRLTKMDFAMTNLKTDLDHAHDKIRENEQTYQQVTKAQNKALLAILLWIKDPEHGNTSQIDEAIRSISV